MILQISLYVPAAGVGAVAIKLLKLLKLSVSFSLC